MLLVDLARRTRTALLWWLLGVLGMAVYVVAVYHTFGNLQGISDLYKQFPPALKKIFGQVDLGTLNGWIQVEFMSWMPLLLAIYAGIYASGAVSREVEQKTVDFILGLPVSRRQFIASRLIIGLANMLFICLSAFVVLVVGVALTGHTPPADRYALSLVNAFLVGAALFAAYTAVAAVVDEQSRATGITLGVTLLLYVATGALRAADAPQVARWLTPFEHYHSAEAMAGAGLPLLPLLGLSAAGVVAGVVALYWYGRRDIAA